jgi:hypothetical protein
VTDLVAFWRAIIAIKNLESQLPLFRQAFERLHGIMMVIKS